VAEEESNPFNFTSKIQIMKLTDYLDTPSVRVFQTFAGESLDELSQFEAWDIVTVLCQAVSDANASDFDKISTCKMPMMLNLQVSDRANKCIHALDGFPTDQVNRLMKAILAVGFEEDLK
jgi:hypothetical protein